MIRGFILVTGLSVAIGLLISCESPTTVDSNSPLGIVLLIGDGMGTGALDAARLSSGQLHLDHLPIRSSLQTASASNQITDSGAAATALATGVRTYNGAIGVGLDSTPVENIIEAAYKQGMATGVVTTSSVTHATPAAFVAHSFHRSATYDIARQFAEANVDVILGGGRSFFAPGGRPDGTDLVSQIRERGCAYITDGADLTRTMASTEPCLVGLFADVHLPPATEPRIPSLVEMTSTALSVLTRDEDGFLLVIEGAQIDWAAHANDDRWTIAEAVDFDAAVGEVVRRLEGRPNTLIVVTADHETGGLVAEVDSASDEVVLNWSTTGHTDAKVPLYARGTSAAELESATVNSGVGQRLLLLLRRGPGPARTLSD